MKRINGAITAAALLGGALLGESTLLATPAGATAPDEHCTSSDVNADDVAVTCTYDPDSDYADPSVRQFTLAVPQDATSIEVRSVGGHGFGNFDESSSDYRTPATAVDATNRTELAGTSLAITVGGDGNGDHGGANGGGNASAYSGAGGGGGSTDVSVDGSAYVIAPGSGGAGSYGGTGDDAGGGVGGTAGRAATGGGLARGESNDANGGGPGAAGSNGTGGQGGTSDSQAGGKGSSHDGGAGSAGWCGNGGGGGGAGYGGGGGGGGGTQADLGDCSGGGGGASGGVLEPAGATARATNDRAQVVVSWVQHLAFTAASPPNATMGEKYAYQFASDDPNATFTAVVDNYYRHIPDGLTLSSSGLLSGTPVYEDNATFTVVVTSAGGIAQRQITVNLQVDPAGPPTITTESLDASTFGTPFEQQLDGTGLDLSWSGAALPDGFSVSSDGVLSGTPTKAGDLPVTVQATDGWGRQTSKDFTLTVAEATPEVSVRYNGTAFVATVSGPDGAAAPGGTVRFEVDGKNRGSVGPKNGTFTKPFAIPAGLHHFTAYYSGDDNYLATNSAQGDRDDPTITASPDRDANGNNWYRAPVTFTFTCATTTAALTAPCPARTTVAGEGANQRLSRTITAKDGGRANTTTQPINIDKTTPSVQATGVSASATYTASTLPKDADAFTGSDALSGLDTLAVKHSFGSSTVTFAALATDKAGNTRKLVVTAKYRGPKPTTS